MTTTKGKSAQITTSQSIKAGDIAIFIRGLNVGKLVHVDRQFTDDEVIDGTTFTKSPTGYKAWVVTSLGGPLKCRHVSGGIDPKAYLTAPFEEIMLRPIRPGRGKDQSLTWTGEGVPA